MTIYEARGAYARGAIPGDWQTNDAALVRAVVPFPVRADAVAAAAALLRMLLFPQLARGMTAAAAKGAFLDVYSVTDGNPHAGHITTVEQRPRARRRRSPDR